MTTVCVCGPLGTAASANPPAGPCVPSEHETSNNTAVATNVEATDRMLEWDAFIAISPWLQHWLLLGVLCIMCCGWVNGGLDVSCMLKMTEKESLSALKSGLKFRVLCVRNQDTGDRIRNLLVIGHFVVDVEFVKG